MTGGDVPIRPRSDPGDLAKKVAELADDEALRKELGERGLERVNPILSWPHQAPNLLQIYEEIFQEDRVGERLHRGRPGLDIPGGKTAVHRTWLRSAVSPTWTCSLKRWDWRVPHRAGQNIAGQSRFISQLAAGYRPMCSTSMLQTGAVLPQTGLFRRSAPDGSARRRSHSWCRIRSLPRCSSNQRSRHPAQFDAQQGACTAQKYSRRVCDGPEATPT